MSRSSVASRPSSADSKPGPLYLWFERSVVPPMRRLGEFAFVAAVREALPWSFIALLAAFCVLMVMPQPLALPQRLAAAMLPAFGVMSGALAIVLPVRLAHRMRLPSAPFILGSCASFALALPAASGQDVLTYLRHLGPSGLFIAMLACGVTGACIALLRQRTHDTPALWAGALAGIVAFAALRAGGVSLPSIVDAAMAPVGRLGDSYLALIAIVFIETLLWTAGVHGPAVLAAIVTPVYMTLQMQNAHALAAHAPLPYVVVVSLFLFVFPGGAGATLPLAALLAVSRVPRLRKLGRATIVPAIFNINDPLLFGTPVVFNPYFVVPFVGAPLILATVTYLAVASGLVARAAFWIPSMVPTFVSTYLATGDYRAVVLAIVNIALATVIYFPFVRAYERHALTS